MYICILPCIHCTGDFFTWPYVEKIYHFFTYGLIVPVGYLEGSGGWPELFGGASRWL